MSQLLNTMKSLDVCWQNMFQSADPAAQEQERPGREADGTCTGIFYIKQMSSDAGGIQLIFAHCIDEALHHLVECLCSSSTIPDILQCFNINFSFYF